MLPSISIGDEFTNPQVYSFAGRSWQKHYEILATEPETMRFGKPDQLLRVRMSCVNCVTGEKRVVDSHKLAWLRDITHVF